MGFWKWNNIYRQNAGRSYFKKLSTYPADQADRKNKARTCRDNYPDDYDKVPVRIGPGCLLKIALKYNLSFVSIKQGFLHSPQQLSLLPAKPLRRKECAKRVPNQSISRSFRNMEIY